MYIERILWKISEMDEEADQQLILILPISRDPIPELEGTWSIICSREGHIAALLLHFMYSLEYGAMLIRDSTHCFTPRFVESNFGDVGQFSLVRVGKCWGQDRV